ncbi:MAG: ABC transporter ATP-binding protein [Pseudomonadales bacterium]|nr:ABC transporter ATP-binding protein [Pseudomonadales bacterium]
MLELLGVSKRVGAEVHLCDVNLKLDRGSMNILLGPTLAGKTSLLRLMAGLDRPSAGDILLDGVSVVGVPVQRRGVAMVYQQFINYPTLSVYENIASPLRVAKSGKRPDQKTIDRKVRAAAELLRLSGQLDKLPSELSGGQQQRTALARALVKESQLVLLDEPLANLDYKLREELRQELPKVFAEQGTILVYASTEPAEALLLGGNTATLHQGRVTQFGRTIEVFQRPRDLQTARIFSDPPLNTASVRKTGSQLYLDQSVIHLNESQAGLPDAEYVLALRPWHLAREQTSTQQAVLDVRVRVAEISGSETFLHVSLGDRDWVALLPGVVELSAETQLPLTFSADSIYLFDQTGALAWAPGGDV